MLNIYKDLLTTFLAMMRSVGLCKTLVTTPPFPAPSSSNFSKSSELRSPILRFSARNDIRRSLCSSSISKSLSFFVTESTLLGAVSISALQKYIKINEHGYYAAKTNCHVRQTKALHYYERFHLLLNLRDRNRRCEDCQLWFRFHLPPRFHFTLARRILHYLAQL